MPRRDGEIVKLEEGTAGLAQSLFDLLRRERAAQRLLHDVAGRGGGDAFFRPDRQLRRRAGDERRLAVCRQLKGLRQVLLADLLHEVVVRARVAGLVDRHHRAAVSHVIVAAGELRADIEMPQHVFVFRVDLPRLRPSLAVPLVIPVNVFAVDGRDAGGVLRALHSSFDLEGVDPGVHQFRQDGKDVHVLHRERIAVGGTAPPVSRALLPIPAVSATAL